MQPQTGGFVDIGLGFGFLVLFFFFSPPVCSQNLTRAYGRIMHRNCKFKQGVIEETAHVLLYHTVAGR